MDSLKDMPEIGYLKPDELRWPEKSMEELCQMRNELVDWIRSEEGEVAQLQFGIDERKGELRRVERDINIRTEQEMNKKWRRNETD